MGYAPRRVVPRALTRGLAGARASAFSAGDGPGACRSSMPMLTPEDRQLNCNILLVEDNEEVAVATEPLLQTVGCTVRWASSGDAARTMIDAEPAVRHRAQRYGDAR